MKIDSKERDDLLKIVSAQPEQWFNVSYQLRALKDGTLEFAGLQCVPLTKKKVKGHD